ncbi:MAG: Protein serine/threonine phosphatase PrpC, regulation of stationary phase [Polyangiaceae bacterium]|jgi:protein phosphatase|nr:Protein serine/threonine phosphatase PrpC, regulation of stationary phase [Polyangiaceae bacterium]
MSLTIGLILAGLLLAVFVLRRRPGTQPKPTSELASNDGDRDTPIEPTRASDLAADFAASLKDDDPVTLLYRGPALFDASELEELDDRPTAPPERTEKPSQVQLCYETEAEETEVTSPRARILLAAQADSDQGKVRRQNEDSVLFIPERQLFAVADGMGGHAGGRVASTIAVQHLREAFEHESFGVPLDSKQELPRRGRELASAVVQSNLAVREAARAEPKLANMGTTLVAARFSQNNQRVYVAHVGDSRCYRFRAGRLRQLTVDHTMRQVGLVGPGADHLFQAIGVTERLNIDLIVDKPLPDDVYLLCSDGLTKMVSDQDICAQLLEESDIEAAVYGLIERANDSGGRDNVSVILIKVLERSIPAVVNAGAAWTKLPSNSNAIWEAGNEEPTVVTSLPPEEQARIAHARKA